jgi:OOP family OmpA-OmpF porin
MRIFMITILGVALAGWMGGSSWYYVCKVRSLCETEALSGAGLGMGEDAGHDSLSTKADSATERGLEARTISRPSDSIPAVTIFPVPPLQVLYQDRVILESPENFRFGRSALIPRISGGPDKLLDSLASFLKANPEREVQLTGLFAKDERNNSENQNLGLGRADFVRGQLISRNIEAGRIITSYESLDKMEFDATDSVNGGIRIQLLDRKIEEKEQVKLLAESRDVYFEWNSARLIMTDDHRQFITRTLQYLKQNPGKTLTLTGHTDNSGKDAYNLKLGLSRAKTVMQYFIEFGADPRQIRTDSKGEAFPIASNETEEGREKNRRVEIRITDKP